jgi:hypothetical protein
MLFSRFVNWIQALCSPTASDERRFRSFSVCDSPSHQDACATARCMRQAACARETRLLDARDDRSALYRAPTHAHALGPKAIARRHLFLYTQTRSELSEVRCQPPYLGVKCR